jgi:hypothetical protein
MYGLWQTKEESDKICLVTAREYYGSPSYDGRVANA